MTDSDQEGEHDAPPVEHVSLSDPEFKKQLATVIPHLRAFGRSLSGSRDVADDLVRGGGAGVARGDRLRPGERAGLVAPVEQSA